MSAKSRAPAMAVMVTKIRVMAVNHSGEKSFFDCPWSSSIKWAYFYPSASQRKAFQVASTPKIPFWSFFKQILRDFSELQSQKICWFYRQMFDYFGNTYEVPGEPWNELSSRWLLVVRTIMFLDYDINLRWFTIYFMTGLSCFSFLFPSSYFMKCYCIQ